MNLHCFFNQASNKFKCGLWQMNLTSDQSKSFSSYVQFSQEIKAQEHYECICQSCDLSNFRWSTTSSILSMLAETGDYSQCIILNNQQLFFLVIWGLNLQGHNLKEWTWGIFRAPWEDSIRSTMHLGAQHSNHHNNFT